MRQERRTKPLQIPPHSIPYSRLRYTWSQFSAVADPLGPIRGDITIVNIYAPNMPYERTVLWQTLVNTLLLHRRWILCNDWNVVETQADKSSKDGCIISGVEQIEFEFLKSYFQVTDFFQRNKKKVYSWNNRRTWEDRVMARLDPVYTFTNPLDIVGAHIE
jgi:hypothetical protein